jgi:hypothetical protein
MINDRICGVCCKLIGCCMWMLRATFHFPTFTRRRSCDCRLRLGGLVGRSDGSKRIQRINQS